MTTTIVAASSATSARALPSSGAGAARPTRSTPCCCCTPRTRRGCRPSPTGTRGGRLQAAGLAVQRLDTSLLDATEPFGFRDGISQPLIEELEPPGQPGSRRTPCVPGSSCSATRTSTGRSPSPRPWRRPTIPAGVLPRTGDPTGRSGRNGSYLVLRQLGQDVDGFGAFSTRPAGGAARPTPMPRPAGGQDGRALAERRAAGAGARPPRATGRRQRLRLPRRRRGRARLPGRRPHPPGQPARRARPRHRPRRVDTVRNRHRLLRRGRAYHEPSNPQTSAASTSSASTPTSPGSSSSCSTPG